AINSGVGVVAAGVSAGADAAGAAGSGRSRPFLLAIRGAMVAFSAVTEPPAGQLTRFRLPCASNARGSCNHRSNVWARSHRNTYRIMPSPAPGADAQAQPWDRRR